MSDKNTSEVLKPYKFHGLHFDTQEVSKEILTECFGCKKPKLYISSEKGLYHCKSCGLKGNSLNFIRDLWANSYESTPDESYEELATNRGILFSDTLKEWGVCKSIITSEWIIPGYNSKLAITQLYKYTKVIETKSGVKQSKMVLMATPTLTHGFMCNSLSISTRKSEYNEVCVFEGPWDGMVAYESFRHVKQSSTGLKYTSNVESSLGKDKFIIAVPGANTFKDEWIELVESKEVVLFYDNDHPRKVEQNGKTKQVHGAGYNGLKHVITKLSLSENKPSKIRILVWGKEGYDKSLKSGYDTRDLLNEKKPRNIPERIPNIVKLISKIGVFPSNWLNGRTKDSSNNGNLELECLPCDNWKDLITSWRKAMKWTEGLDRGLSIMLASCVSTMATGDQLWVKIIGPASCGKSTLCEALTVCKKYVIGKSTIRGFHSGYRETRNTEEDNSLLSSINGKTLITKDGDTLLQSPNLSQILSEARDIYDRSSRTHYRNRASKDYDNISMTWILCGTASLRSLDSSELGERFLDCVLMEGIDDEIEDEITLRVARRAREDLNNFVGHVVQEDNNNSMTIAKQITGGYVSHLRENAIELLSKVKVKEEDLNYCTRLGKFVAFLRARPSIKQDESAEREFSARLVSQHVRLAVCLAVVMNKTTLDDEIFRRVKRVAFDTARGITMDIVKYLYKSGPEGVSMNSISIIVGITDDKAKKLIRFLRKIEVVEIFQKVLAKGVKGQNRYRLTPKLFNLCSQVKCDW